MSPDPSRRSDRSKLAILSAALDLLTEVGYLRLSVEAIAARAGVGKQTIYRWWPSKGAVVFDAILGGDAIGDGADGAPGLIPDTGDVRRDFQTLLEGSVAEFTDPDRDRLFRTIIAEVQHDPVLSQELIERLLSPQYDAAVERIRAGQRAGQIDAALDPRIAMEMLFGPVLHRWLLRTTPLEASYVERLIDHVFGGLSPA